MLQITLCTTDLKQSRCCSHHEEGVSDPEAAPARGAGRDGDVLAVHRDGQRGHLAHRAAADVLRDLVARHRHHGDGRAGGEPVGLVIAAGVVADLIDVAVDERHGAEARQAGAGKTWRGERQGIDCRS